MAEPAVFGNQSIERAARMLGLFSAEEPALALSEITARMGMTKATAHRYATALRRAGLLRFADGAYTLGPRVVELAVAALAGLGVVKLAGPYLERLVERTSHTAVLSVWDGEAPVVVRTADNTDRLVRIVVATGSRLPLESAQGQIFRAFLNGDPGLEHVREQRFAAYAEVVEGIAAVAAPVFQGDDVVATLALVGTAASIGHESSEALTRELREAADALSTELGFVSDERRER
jgi:DNA-binding IclR family transcriptional regulator